MRALYSYELLPSSNADMSGVESLLAEFDNKNKATFSDPLKAIDGAIAKAGDLHAVLDEEITYFDNSIMATSVAYVLAVLYNSLYNICIIFDNDKSETMTRYNIPPMIEYKDLRELRNTIGVRYTSPSIFIDEDISELLDFVKSILRDCDNSITLEDCLNINSILDLAADNIDKLVQGKKTVAMGKDFSIEIIDRSLSGMPTAGAAEAEEEKTVEAAESIGKAASFFDKEPETDFMSAAKDAEELKEEAQEAAESAEEVSEDPVAASGLFDFMPSAPAEKEEKRKFVFEDPVEEVKEEPAEEAKAEPAEETKAEPAEETVAAEPAEEEAVRETVEAAPLSEEAALVSEIKKGIEGLKATMVARDNIRNNIKSNYNIQTPDSAMTGESKAIMDNLMKDINAIIDTHLKPLNDKLAGDYSNVESKLDSLYALVDGLKDQLTELKENI